MAKHVGAIDQGVASTRCMIFDHDGHEVARHQLAHEQIAPQDGWVEHDPHEIWEATQDVVQAVLGRAGTSADDLAAIGITNQRETTVVWDRRTGVPYYNAIAREDTRTGTIGSGGKIQWILANVADVRADAEAGHAVFGTIDTWLIWWLTGGPDTGLHVTDITNAGRTMLMDPKTLAWDDELLALIDVPPSMLPDIRSSSEIYGRTTEDSPFGGGVAVAGDLADQHAALIGQACLRPGEAMSTGEVLVLNTGTEMGRSGDASLTTVAYRLGDAPAVYALEGSAAAIAAAGLELRTVRVDGGITIDDASMQGWADALGVPVSRPVVAETAALGSAYAAGLATGFWADTDDIVANWNESRRWEPASTG
jgi:glycerol kinase